MAKIDRSRTRGFTALTTSLLLVPQFAVANRSRCGFSEGFGHAEVEYADRLAQVQSFFDDRKVRINKECSGWDPEQRGALIKEFGSRLSKAVVTDLERSNNRYSSLVKMETT